VHKSLFLEVAETAIQSKKIHMCMYPVSNRVISLYSSKIVDKKDILCTVSNTSIYCSSDKDHTVYLV
jgi:hypothetical protein